MYLDVDTNGIYSINDMTKDELNIILTSLTDFHHSRDRTSDSLSCEVRRKLLLQRDKLEQDGQFDKI